MKRYNSISQVEEKPRVLVLGNFDGVHLGHRALFAEAKVKAKQRNCELMAFTFYPQWQGNHASEFGYIYSQEKKEQILEQLGVDALLTIPFDESIAQISPQDFVENILKRQLYAQEIVVGYNYSFGHKAAGNAELLKELGANLGIEVRIVDAFVAEDAVVSSSLIRSLIRQGEVEKANRLLGAEFSFKGEVVHGRHVGRTIGVPTANIKIEDDLLLPRSGVYAARVWLGAEQFWGILNVGKRPTLNNGTDTSIEVHILDFDRDIYGEIIEAEMLRFFRPESKFTGLEDLKRQIDKDIVCLREMIEVL